MRGKTIKFFLIATALFLGAQGLFALSASCPQRGDEHRCCRETKRATLSQVKKPPPCAHCFEKTSAAQPLAVTSVHVEMPIPVVRDAAAPLITARSIVQAFLPERDIPPRLKIPLLLRQILI